jgi:hypothetical protein
MQDDGRALEFFPRTWADTYADVSTVNRRGVAATVIFVGIALGFLGGFLFRYVAFS